MLTIEFEHGIDPVMDVFVEHPRARARTLESAVAPDESWRFDRIDGPEGALERLDEALLDPGRCHECLDRSEDCGATREYEVLERDATSRVVHTHTADPGLCDSVPTLASEHLGFGVRYDACRRQNAYEWRLLMPDDGGVGSLHTALEAALGDGLSVDVRRLSEPAHRSDRFVPREGLSYEKREALEAAVLAGYYETPRDATLEELAEHLDLARSTLRYRLRRAEAWLVDRTVGPTRGRR